MSGNIILGKTNYAKTTITTNPLLSSGTAITVPAGAASLFPLPGKFRAVIWGSSHASPLADPNREIVTATYYDTDAFTITRGEENTNSAEWPAGSNIALVVTGGVMQEIEGLLPRLKVLSEQMSSNITTLLDAFLFQGLDPGYYRIRAKLLVLANATGGHKYQISGMAGLCLCQVNSINNATGAFVITDQITASDPVSSTGGTAICTEIEGAAYVGQGEYIALQFAQATVSGTSYILAGSFMEVQLQDMSETVTPTQNPPV